MQVGLVVVEGRMQGARVKRVADEEGDGDGRERWVEKCCACVCAC